MKMILSFKLETIDTSTVNIIGSNILTEASLKYTSANSITIINSTITSKADIGIESPIFYCANSTIDAVNIYLPEYSSIDQSNCQFYGVTYYGHMDL